MLILSSEEVKKALSMPAALEAVEIAYKELGQGKAINRPRTDCWSPMAEREDVYLLKSMDGLVPGLQTSAVRINSNHVVWKEYAGHLVKASSGGKYIGLVVLLDLSNGQPLALFPDEFVQAVRVGATTGLAIRYLSPDHIHRAAVIGSGRQAAAAIEALFCVRRPLMGVAIYSPNPEHRNALAARLATKGLTVQSSVSAESAVEGADLILLATSSIGTVCMPGWVTPGRFISCVKYTEAGEKVTSLSKYVIVNAHEGSPINYVPGAKAFPGHDPIRELGIRTKRSEPPPREPDWTIYPELSQVIAGTAKGPEKNQSVLFINNIGMGIQFAAVGRALYSAARNLGLGLEVSL